MSGAGASVTACDPLAENSCYFKSINNLLFCLHRTSRCLDRSLFASRLEVEPTNWRRTCIVQRWSSRICRLQLFPGGQLSRPICRECAATSVIMNSKHKPVCKTLSIVGTLELCYRYCQAAILFFP
jgi:hypothetical protein